MTRIHHLLTSLAVVALLIGIAGCGDEATKSLTEPAMPMDDDGVYRSPDSQPPATPTGVNALVQTRQVKLRWDPNLTDTDFVGFVVARTAMGVTVPLTDQPQDITSFIDTHPFDGVAVYDVRSVDDSSNESVAVTIVVDLQRRPPAFQDGR